MQQTDEAAAVVAAAAGWGFAAVGQDSAIAAASVCQGCAAAAGRGYAAVAVVSVVGWPEVLMCQVVARRGIRDCSN